MSENKLNIKNENSGVTDDNKLETRVGVLIAIFAAIMAISDLFAGKFGEDEIKFTNEKSAAYSWYQAKSIKETLIEGQVDLLKSMLQGHVIQSSSEPAIQKHIQDLQSKQQRYEKDKKEILMGSAALSKEQWSQEVDGKLGQVIGAKDYEARIEVLSKIGDQFDVANLFFQLALVLGAICLVSRKQNAQKMFYTLMFVLGLLGTGFSAYAFYLSMM